MPMFQNNNTVELSFTSMDKMGKIKNADRIRTALPKKAIQFLEGNSEVQQES